MIQAYNLKTEYLAAAVGIDILAPRIFWNVQGAVRQTAYQLRTSVNEESWQEYPAQDTNLMNTKLPMTYKSRDRVRWQVRLTDENGQQGEWSETAYAEIGLASPDDWRAVWIMGNYKHDASGKVRYPVDLFRKTFALQKQVLRARLYSTACGMYTMHLNGSRVGEFVMAPGSTNFAKRVHYQTYDVTALLQSENVWDIALADGFYASDTGVFDTPKPFGYEPKVLAQLEVYFTDGTSQTFCTDKDFAWCNDGPVRFADMKNGERIDFNRTPTYSGYAAVTRYDGIVCASDSVPVNEHERLSHPKVLLCPDGHTVLDFGQNIAGYAEVKLQGAAGKTCALVFGEKLDENGNFTYMNISYKGEYTKCHFQTITLTCEGKAHTYKPDFTVMGFRYVLLLDWPEQVVPENFTAIAVYSDMATTFAFTSTDAVLNQIVQNTFWSVKGNFLDVPTDCPTRERAGWTGDAQLFFNTGNYMMDQRAFFRKWLTDVVDGMREDGLVFNINPGPRKESRLINWLSMEGSAGWGDALITIPYYFWKRYGDDTLLREFWEPMTRCYDFFHSRMGKRNLFSLANPKHSEYDKYLVACGRHFGEWTEPDDCAPSKTALLFPMAEEATAYLSYTSRLMAEMAAHCGKKDAVARYEQTAENTQKAYNHYFVGDGMFETKRMCKYVRPVGLDLCSGAVRENLLRQIVKLNQKRNYRVGTGFLTTPFLFEALSEAGAGEDAYKTLTNPNFGWAQQIKQGATTVWENWTDDASLNHYSKGACCQWLFDCVCGIRLDGIENHFVIAPHKLNGVEDISFTYDSAYGAVKSGWHRGKEKIEYTIEIPANCTAEFTLPGGKTKTLQAGNYTFMEALAQ